MNEAELLSLFALGFSSLLPLVNPIGTALIVNPYFSSRTPAERKAGAFSVAFACLMMGLAALFLGSWVLKAMGISISVTQMAGGFVIANLGLGILNSKNEPAQAHSAPEDLRQSLFFPVAFPLTVGPGVISTLIALSAHAHAEALSVTMLRMGVLGLSLLTILVITYFCFAYSDLLISRVGKTGSHIFNRLMAFLVFCIGIQMAVTGLTRTFPSVFHP